MIVSGNSLFKKPFSLVPIIDIIFLLLIFFLVVATLISGAYEKQNQVYVTMAVPRQGSSAIDAVLFVFGRGGRYWVRAITAEDAKGYPNEPAKKYRVTTYQMKRLYREKNITPQMRLLLVISPKVPLLEFAKIYNFCVSRQAKNIFSIAGNSSFIKNRIRFVQKRKHWNRKNYEKW
ncbi:MAG TPA: hypothetical protein ENH49_03370 [Candidatus Marinimicrobia bacterium]|nr:hypothetical protein [Candidatus Neomarinimicrobiota bacterium]